jgi:hypothetical protein
MGLFETIMATECSLIDFKEKVSSGLIVSVCSVNVVEINVKLGLFLD